MKRVSFYILYTNKGNCRMMLILGPTSYVFYLSLNMIGSTIANGNGK